MLCVAGDVSEHMEILETVWKILVPRFHRVFFVVGNHDLWTSLEHKVILKARTIWQKECSDSTFCCLEKLSDQNAWFRWQDSISKFKAINEQCKAHGVRTAPELVGGQVWVVPLQSWYCDMVEKGGMPSTDLAPLQVNTVAAI